MGHEPGGGPEELAARKVDIVKVWVDDRDDKFKKLTPDLYGAIIDEAHKNGLRVTAHIFNLADAKGLMKAGVDAFAHSVRDKDIDEEGLAMFKQHPNLVVDPNLPDRGVAVDLSWLSEVLPADELKKLQDVFGYLNDVVTAKQLDEISEEHCPESLPCQRAAGYVIGWHTAEAAHCWACAKKGWKDLEKTHRFWR